MRYQGFVYCIASDGDRFVKIGATQTPDARLLNLQAATPHQLTFVGLAASLSMFECERKVHNMLSDRRIRGEWFDNEYGEALDVFEAVLGGACMTSFPEPVVDVALTSRTPFDGWVKANFRTQKEMSAATGFTAQSIGKWAKGVTIPSHQDQVRIEKLTAGNIAVGSWSLVSNPVHFGSGKPCGQRIGLPSGASQ